MKAMADPAPTPPSRGPSAPRGVGRAPSDRRGFALEATIAVLLLLVVLSAVAATGAATMIRTSSVDLAATRLGYAVDATADHLMAQIGYLQQRVGVPTQADLDSLPPPSLGTGTLANVTIRQAARPVAAPTTDLIRSGPRAGMIAEYRAYDLDITASDPAANTSRAVLRVEAQQLPVTSFAMLYGADLELTRTGLTVLGPVHTNGRLYACANGIAGTIGLFGGVSAVGGVIRNFKHGSSIVCGTAFPNVVAISRTTPAAGVPFPSDTSRLNFDSRGTGNTTCCASPAQDAQFAAEARGRMGGRLNTGSATGLDSVRLLLPAGVAPRELIEPRAPADPAALRRVKFAWQAAWQLTVDASAIGDLCANIANPAWSERTDGRALPDPAACAGIFGVATFQDDREQRPVQALTVNLANLRAWVLADSANRTVPTLYVTFTGGPSPTSGAGATPATAPLPAVRLEQGARMPNAMTIASSHPVYVLGDLNLDRTSLADTATAWRPTALMADAVTLLSPAWTDAANTGPGSNRDPAAPVLYVRAAVIAGHAPTTRGVLDPVNADWFDNGGPTTFGGGLYSLTRLLESWTGRVLNFRGSLVSLWYSSYASWRHTATFYLPPSQATFAFEERFRPPASAPPGVPRVGSVYSVGYRPVY